MQAYIYYIGMSGRTWNERTHCTSKKSWRRTFL